VKKILILLAVIFSIYIIFIKDEIEKKLIPDIVLVSLNSTGGSHLDTLQKKLKKLGFICTIDSPKFTDYNNFLYLPSEAQMEFGNDTFFYYDSDEPITVYVTNSELVDNGVGIRGICYGNQIYAHNSEKLCETTVHEILHSFGLEHCNNRCIMNSSSEFRWNEKTDKPLLCSDCLSKTPLRF